MIILHTKEICSFPINPGMKHKEHKWSINCIHIWGHLFIIISTAQRKQKIQTHHTIWRGKCTPCSSEPSEAEEPKCKQVCQRKVGCNCQPLKTDISPDNFQEERKEHKQDIITLKADKNRQKRDKKKIKLLKKASALRRQTAETSLSDSPDTLIQFCKSCGQIKG